jgi:hypothetical protein
MAGITLVQRRGLEVGRRRFQAGRQAEFALHQQRRSVCGPSIRGPVLYLVFLLRVCFRFPLIVAGIETGVVAVGYFL